MIYISVLIFCGISNYTYFKIIKDEKYDVYTNNISYYETAVRHYCIFPEKYNGEWDIKEFHYYSYKNEKYEIVLYVFFKDDDFDNELERLLKLEYSFIFDKDEDTKKYFLLENDTSLLYEYVVIDKARKCIYYAYSYGISRENSSINKKYIF